MNNQIKRTLVVLLVASVCVGLMTSLPQTEPEAIALEDSWASPEATEALIRLTPAQIEATQLEIQSPRSKRLDIVHTLPARVVLNANRHTHVTTETSGVARGVHKALGDTVEVGDVLAVLESRDIADAKSAYIATVRRESLAKTTLAREQQLHQRKILAEADYLIAKNDAEQATSERELAEQKLLALRYNPSQISSMPQTGTGDLARHELLAPCAGTVVERDLSVGELISAGKEVYAIADLTTLWIEIGVHGQDMDKIQKGQVIQVKNPQTQAIREATIVYFSPIVDGQTRVARAIAELDNTDGTWRPGTYVHALVPIATKHVAVTVPKGAIQRVEGKEVVFVHTADGLEAREVEVGLADDEDVEIVDGLTADESCATKNTFTLKSELLKSDEDDE